jgi:hypothetical protein
VRHNGRLRRLEQSVERRAREVQEVDERDAFPITFEQLGGVRPMTAGDDRRLRKWMLRHGFRETESGELEDDPATYSWNRYPASRPPSEFAE